MSGDLKRYRQENDLLTFGEVADALGVGREVVRRLGLGNQGRVLLGAVDVEWRGHEHTFFRRADVLAAREKLGTKL